MWWRDNGERQQATARDRAQTLVETSDHPVGLLAYAQDEAVGWVAVSPREEYPRLDRGRDTAPVDSSPAVWAVPCFFVVPQHRNAGVARALLAAAVALAASAGAKAVEGVPGDPATRRRSDTASYTGSVALFASEGFSEVARRTPKGRVVMRRRLDG
jgi:GNAT superfamily N-acetyltransferase